MNKEGRNKIGRIPASKCIIQNYVLTYSRFKERERETHTHTQITRERERERERDHERKKERKRERERERVHKRETHATKKRRK